MRRIALVSSLVRAGARFGVSFGLAALFLLGANDALQTAAAEGDTRTLSFHHLHTGENITVTFKRDGRYDDAALKKLDWFMRDWRREESVKMDPHLFDVLWEAYREVGGKQPIDVICGYRAPGTNAMLRARSSGVAENSRHTKGQAMDFAIPGVPLEKIRNIGLRLQAGGVGFYPTSGSPFVHMDTGSVRHWPRIARAELMKIFPNGRTVHIPTDGEPLPGYALALADVERRGNEPSGVSLAAARDAGVVTAGIVTASIETGAASANASPKPKRSLLERIILGDLTGDSAGDDEEAGARAPVAIASLSAAAAKPKRIAVETIVPLPTARPRPVAIAVAVMTPMKTSTTMTAAKPTTKPAAPNTVTAALPANLFDNRGIWVSAVESGVLPAPVDTAPASAKTPFANMPYELASADHAATGSTGALAYAPETPPQRPAQPRPMGATMPRLPAAASVMPASARAAMPSATPTHRLLASDLSGGGGQRSGSPWLRAAILTPSVTGFMSATPLGAPHMRPLANLLRKPAQALVMTFSADPHLGMTADRFSGRAVTFLATATFTHQQTAALR